MTAAGHNRISQKSIVSNEAQTFRKSACSARENEIGQCIRPRISDRNPWRKVLLDPVNKVLKALSAFDSRALE